jgi:hypothetical protein
MASNTTTKKEFSGMKDETMKSRPSKSASLGNSGPVYEGQIYEKEKFAEPMNAVTAKISGIGGTYNDIGELSGFITDGYTDKNGTPYGENAKFNFLPPGMDINNQENAEIHNIPMVMITAASYPGDGWMPTPRDLKE